MTLTFRRAQVDETPIVVDLLRARVAWLRDRGLTQWGSLDPARDTGDSIAAGETWVLVDDSGVVATITMSSIGNSGFWTIEELEEPALYVSKMATWPTVAGRGLGRTLLDSTTRYAAHRGISRLRWDAWKTNEHLHQYYSNQGAQYLRTVDLPGGWNSGALFESSYQVPADTSTFIDAPTEMVLALSSTRSSTSTGLSVARASHRGWASPADHWHVVQDLNYGYLGAPTDETGERSAMIDSDAKCSPFLLMCGDRWRAAANGATQPATGAALGDLRPGQVYFLRHYENGPGGCGVAIMGDVLHTSNDAAPDLPVGGV